jgi:hypothetical protein
MKAAFIVWYVVREEARKSDNRIDLGTTRRSGDRDVKDSPEFAPCALLMENDSVARPCCLSLCPELLHQCKRQRTNALRTMDLDLGLLLESAPSATGCPNATITERRHNTRRLGRNA